MKNIWDNITATDIVLARQINDITREEAEWALAQMEKDLPSSQSKLFQDVRRRMAALLSKGYADSLQEAIALFESSLIKAVVFARREAINNTERVFRGRRFQMVKCPEGADIADVLTAWDFVEKYAACVHPNDRKNGVSFATIVVRYPGLVEVNVTLVGNKDFRFVEKK